MKLLFGDFHPWAQGLTLGNTHYLRSFRKDGHETAWVSQFLHYARLLRRKDDTDREFVEAWKRGFHRTDDRVWAFTPLSLLPHVDAPVLGGSWVGRNTLRWTIPSTRRVLRRGGFGHPDVLWIGIPRVASLMRCVKPKNIVYRMCDLFTGFDGQPSATERIEREICEQSTVVFATARMLVERASQWCENVIYLPNGVDIDRFNCYDAIEPLDLVNIPRPRLIYVGALSSYVDFGVFEVIASARPDVSIVIVGPIRGVSSVKERVEERLRTLVARHSNIYYLGPKSFEDAPRYMHHSDVGIIPFSASELEHAVSPIKLFEYAAAGLPVVGRALRESMAANSDTLFYETPDECIQRIDEALAAKELLGEKMRAFAERNTWETRYQTIKEAFQKYGISE